MAEYSKMARGYYVANGATKVISLPFKPQRIEFQNRTTYVTGNAGTTASGFWDSYLPQDSVMLQIMQSTTPTSLTTNYVTSGGINTFDASQALALGPVNIGSRVFTMTKGTTTQVASASAHGLQSGDVVIFQGLYQTSSTGMPQICGIPFTITRVDSLNFTIPWNTNQTNYTAIATGGLSGANASFRKVLYPYLYSPGVSFINAITLGTTTTVSTTQPHNLSVGSTVCFRIPKEYGTVELNSLPNQIIPGSPLYGNVISVVDADTVVVNIDSSNFTAFSNNVAVASVDGLSFPQMLAVGDVNTGGIQYSGGLLYPSPVVNGASIQNGPAINGAFVNNSRYGFSIGSEYAGLNNDFVLWQAYYYDLSY
jgi:hypothetical protein